MGFGIDFKTNIFLNRYTSKNLYEVKSDIEDKEKEIESLKEQILMFGSSNPKDIVPDDWKEAPIIFIQNQINNCFELIMGNKRDIVLLGLYKKYLEDNKTGDGYIDKKDLVKLLSIWDKIGFNIDGIKYGYEEDEKIIPIDRIKGDIKKLLGEEYEANK